MRARARDGERFPSKTRHCQRDRQMNDERKSERLKSNMHMCSFDKGSSVIVRLTLNDNGYACVCADILAAPPSPSRSISFNRYQHKHNDVDQQSNYLRTSMRVD